MKKIISLLLAVLMLTALFACTKTATTEAPKAEASQATEAPKAEPAKATEAPKAEATAEPAPEPTAEPAPEPTAEEKLLTEIRDLLKEK